MSNSSNKSDTPNTPAHFDQHLRGPRRLESYVHQLELQEAAYLALVQTVSAFYVAASANSPGVGEAVLGGSASNRLSLTLREAEYQLNSLTNALLAKATECPQQERVDACLRLLDLIHLRVASAAAAISTCSRLVVVAKELTADRTHPFLPLIQNSLLTLSHQLTELDRWFCLEGQRAFFADDFRKDGPIRS